MINNTLNLVQKHPKRFFIALASGFLVIAAVCLLLPKTTRITNEDAAQIIRLMISNTLADSGNDSPLYRAPELNSTNLPWKLHVDLSASMIGYVNPEQSEFKNVLDRFYTRLAARFEAAGDFPPKSTSQLEPGGFSDYLKPAFYIRVGVGYSNELSKFAADTNFNHVLITDGVLVQNGQLVPPRYVSDLVKRLLSNGGEFAVLVGRSHYEGRYSSVTLHGRYPPQITDSKNWTFPVASSNRPFLIWVFTQPGQKLEEATRYLGRPSLDPDLESDGDRKYALTAQATDVEAIEGVKLEPLIVQRRGQSRAVLAKSELGADSKGDGKDVFSELTSLEPPSFAPTWMGDIFRSGEPVPFNFDISSRLPPFGDGATNVSLISKALLEQKNNKEKTTVSLVCWELARRKTATPNAWELRGIKGLSQTPKFGIPEDAGPTNGCLNMRLVISEGRPELSPENSDSLLAWMLTLSSSPSAQRLARWRDLSTDDDSKPASAGSIYRLKDFLEVLSDECVVDDRLVFFTYWPR